MIAGLAGSFLNFMALLNNVFKVTNTSVLTDVLGGIDFASLVGDTANRFQELSTNDVARQSAEDFLADSDLSELISG